MHAISKKHLATAVNFCLDAAVHRHDAAGTVTQLSAGPSNASYIESVSAYAASQASSSHASSSTLPGQSKPGKLAFDPLAKRKGKAAAVTAPAAAPQDPFASAGSQSSDKPALPHEVAQLSDDLAKLVAEWSQGGLRAAMCIHTLPLWNDMWDGFLNYWARCLQCSCAICIGVQ